MTQYLISFEDGAMDFPEEELPEVAEAAHAVVQEAKDAGVFVFTGGLDYDAKHPVVATDGMVTDGPYPESKELIGGVFVVDVPTWETAVEWAAKVAVACRCAQDVREFFPFRRSDLENDARTYSPCTARHVRRALRLADRTGCGARRWSAGVSG